MKTKVENKKIANDLVKWLNRQPPIQDTIDKIYKNCTVMTLTKKEVGTLAFIKLRNDGNKDAALRLAAHLIDGKGISLGISNLDWEIQNAIDHCTNCNKPPYSTNDRGWIYFSFVGEVEISQEQEEKNRIEFYD